MPFKGYVLLLLSILLPFSAYAADKPQDPPAATPVAPFLVPDVAADKTATQRVTLPATLRQAPYDPSLPVVVIVDKSGHKTHLLQMQGKEIVDILTVPDAVGKPSTPTPTGRARITWKQLDPIWYPPASIDPTRTPVPPYSKTHKNPLGVAALGTSMGGILLHGTNNPSSIGKSISHGCIRHQNDDIMKIYTKVVVGTPVYMVGKFAGASLLVSDFSVKAKGSTK